MEKLVEYFSPGPVYTVLVYLFFAVLVVLGIREIVSMKRRDRGKDAAKITSGLLFYLTGALFGVLLVELLCRLFSVYDVLFSNLVNGWETIAEFVQSKRHLNLGLLCFGLYLVADVIALYRSQHDWISTVLFSLFAGLFLLFCSRIVTAFFTVFSVPLHAAGHHQFDVFNAVDLKSPCVYPLGESVFFFVLFACRQMKRARGPVDASPI